MTTQARMTVRGVAQLFGNDDPDELLRIQQERIHNPMDGAITIDTPLDLGTKMWFTMELVRASKHPAPRTP